MPIDFQPIAEPKGIDFREIDFQPEPLPQKEPVIQQKNIGGRLAQLARPVLEVGGAIIGGISGSGTGPLGTIAGGSLGYAGGKQLANRFEEAVGVSKPRGLVEEAKQLPSDLAEGAAMEMAGPLIGKGIQAVAGGIGKVVKPVIGRLTGTGTAAVEEAIKSGKQGGGVFKSSTSFDKALRGEITGEEVVQHAHDALRHIKTIRASTYQEKLKELAQSGVKFDLRNVAPKIVDTIKSFVRVDPVTKNIDWSRSALGPENSEGVKKIKDIVEMIQSHGSIPEDITPLGMDRLKRQLGSFYSDNSEARAFVAEMYDIVNKELRQQVPGYRQMTKGYEEATRLIKDIESGLMMRKQGMSGRITADQTLRRLNSAMRDNFALRKDLVEALDATGQDISGQVAGYALSEIVPRGIAGTGPALTVHAALSYLNPAFVTTLVASSPRVAGEFLRIYGKAIKQVKGIEVPIGKTMAYLSLKRKEAGNDN